MTPTLESRVLALEEHCNHSLANAKLLALGEISINDMKDDVLERPYLADYVGCGAEPLTVDQLANEDLAYENACMSVALESAHAEIANLGRKLQLANNLIAEMKRLISPGF